MKASEITYLTEPHAEYNAGITSAKTPADLVAFLEGWEELAPDALAVARAIDTPEAWTQWQEGLEKERRRKFAGEAWAARFAVIVMPEKMVRVTIAAEQFSVPWGLAWIRLAEEGLLDG
jgi:hypothetical protein